MIVDFLMIFRTVLSLVTLLPIHAFVDEIRYRSRSIPGSFPAEITGINLENISEKELSWIKQQLHDHRVLVFRNQPNFTVEGQRAFTQKFGTLQVHVEKETHLQGYSDVNVISNLVNSTGSAIGLSGNHVEKLHSDLSWETFPSGISVLHSIILPSIGGDTHFVDSIAAYEDLSESMKQDLYGLKGVYSYLKVRGDVPGLLSEENNRLRQGSIHPLISYHSDLHKKNIFANEADTIYILEKTKEESDCLLTMLFHHLHDPKYLYIHEWKEHDVVIWDNRGVQHRGTSAPNTPRKLYRTNTIGEEVVEDNKLNNNEISLIHSLKLSL